MSSPIAPNAPYSRSCVIPTGAPSRTMRPIGASRSVSARHGTSAGRTHRRPPASRRSGMTHRLAVDAHAEPTGPSAVTPKKYRLPSATAASAVAETWPTTIVSTTPIRANPTWTSVTGTASRSVSRSSARSGVRGTGEP